ncbi:MAG: mannitol dehydrogenase family protein [Pseudomonadota bacterium]
MPTRLSADTLSTLKGVAVPQYDRTRLRPGIVHFGVGNFHRAHQAVYLDSLFGMGRDQEFAIVGAGVREGDKAMRDALASQSYLTTVVEQSAQASTARVTGPMIDFLPVSDTPAILARLADPATRIVSLTITEGSYYLDAAGAFDGSHPDILADAATPDQPKTVFGLIAAALKARRAAAQPPFTVMSCDNVPHNGVVARAAVAGLAAHNDGGLAAFIEGEVAFPNAMVDRITPATSQRERDLLRDDFGIEDAWPVFCEDFTQWVLEDTFSHGRPALQDVGVEFVPDVTPYELMKIRILNGGHAVMAYPAALMGIEFAHEAMEEPLIAGFFRKVEDEEILPVVPPVPNTDTVEYCEKVFERFANPKIGDTIARLCFDGSNRQPKFIVPSVRDRLAAGGTVEGLALESALWCRYCAGTTDAGTPIAPNDPRWDDLTALAIRAKDEPAAWLSMERVYGETAHAPQFRDPFHKALRALWEAGTRTVLERYLRTGSAAP